ncbi:S-methyl-5-thioribose kinase [uncultured Dysosmobacter sp.]|uniref:S-methyl-5-thioribose kinase n=1 Tax=uncultured Dysosmobacter sp. TaxID=2591384 RepID=UPI002607E019|nr:S-methyl-5-thioribose kinase [uncultured Dysosmobacter sp.]
MRDFSQFFLMTPDDVRRYAVEVLHKFDSNEETDCVEIGDGNINYVFRVRSKRDGHSIIVKQADKLLRSSGRPLDICRNKIEAAVLQLEGKLAPGYVPAVYYYDETMAATTMEDVSAFKNLRKELAANRVYPHLAENISAFMADTLLPTTDLVLDRAEKKKRVKFFTNPELCEITEDLVLTEPYDDFKKRNVLTPGNEAFVREFLYNDQQLHAEVGKLRNNFMNNAQALLHGDLHSGSIFANKDGIRVLDPEFAFYGPMGYDIGNVIGNLFFAWASKVYATPEETEAAAALEQTISAVCDLTMSKLAAKYDEMVTFSLYRTSAFRQAYLDGVLADSLGYAGTEIIRRVVGDSKVAELTSVSELSQRILMDRALIKLGITLIKHREHLRNGSSVVHAFRMILA